MSNGKLQYASFEQAKRLKALGFDLDTNVIFYTGKPDSGHIPSGIPQDTYWDNHNTDDYKVSAPTVALALKWCRDVKQIVACVKDEGCIEVGVYHCAYYYSIRGNDCLDEFDTYEDAETALLDAVLGVLEKGGAL